MITFPPVSAGCAMRRLTCAALAALSIGAVPSARAGGPAPEHPTTPYVKDNGEVVLMVCRRGLERQDMQPMQEMPQDLPLLCLATQTSADVLQMGPARFQQLLETAAASGAMLVIVMPE